MHFSDRPQKGGCMWENVDVCVWHVVGRILMRRDRVFGVCIRNRRVAVVTEMLLCYSLKTGKELFLRS